MFVIESRVVTGAIFIAAKKEAENKRKSRREEEKIYLSTTNSKLHRFFEKQLSININAGSLPPSPAAAGEGLGVGGFLSPYLERVR
jgi:hypothetical protein